MASRKEKRPVAANIAQGCLFELDYLVRTLGSIATSAEVALTELVANAWDAGAAQVDITVPEGDEESTLVLQDDGVGMTADQFREKWMTLGYDRVRHQGRWAEFPPSRADWKRPAYGRNGVGRHGMLCFGSTYQVETRRGGAVSKFSVATTSGKEPFEIVSAEVTSGTGHGTTLKTIITRNMPSPDRVRNILSARFLHDPRFVVKVNGRSVQLSEHEGLIDRQQIAFANGLTAEAFFIDSTKSAKSTQYQGVAFWVGGRLVGEPGWAAGTTIFLDGRTRIAKRYSVVVRSDDLFDDVLPDWSGFKKSERVEQLFDQIANYVQGVFTRLSAERITDTTEAVFREHRGDLDALRPLAKLELSQFVNSVTTENPTIAAETLSIAVKAIINIEKSRAGSALLEKLSQLSDTDIAALDRLLGEWSVRDALTVLDEIDRRILVIEAVKKLSSDHSVDELHTLHPLISESRWLFGHEFDTPEFASNAPLNTAMAKIFGKRADASSFANPRKRPDLLVISDASVCGAATEQVNDETGIVNVRDVLLIELKRGDSSLNRENVDQACGYIEDLLASGLLDGKVARAFVVGQRIRQKVHQSRSTRGRPCGCRSGTCGYLQSTGKHRAKTVIQIARKTHQTIRRSYRNRSTRKDPCRAESTFINRERHFTIRFLA